MFHMDLPTLLCSPICSEAYGKTIYKKSWQPLLLSAGVASKHREEAALNFIQAVKTRRPAGIGDTIPEIQEEDIPERYHTMRTKEADPLYPVPVLMDAQELKAYADAG